MGSHLRSLQNHTNEESSTKQAIAMGTYTYNGHMETQLHMKTHRRRGNDTAEKGLQWRFFSRQIPCKTVKISPLAPLWLHKQKVSKFKCWHIGFWPYDLNNDPAFYKFNNCNNCCTVANSNQRNPAHLVFHQSAKHKNAHIITQTHTTVMPRTD